jgi:hypothetical protein
MNWPCGLDLIRNIAKTMPPVSKVYAKILETAALVIWGDRIHRVASQGQDWVLLYTAFWGFEGRRCTHGGCCGPHPTSSFSFLGSSSFILLRTPSPPLSARLPATATCDWWPKRHPILLDLLVHLCPRSPSKPLFLRTLALANLPHP